MEKDKILLIRLEGPLQSWGERSKWDYRDTADFPTKSGVIGMIACAMGLERTDAQIGKLCEQLYMAVRADRKGEIITDFHTVTAEKLLKANGEKRANGNTVISRRSYLQDASFLIALEGEDTVIEECSQALKHPKWSIYLGRKSCVPSVPVIGVVIAGGHGSLEEVIKNQPLTARHDSCISYQIESDREGYARSDERLPVSDRRYGNRFVKVGSFIPEKED